MPTLGNNDHIQFEIIQSREAKGNRVFPLTNQRVGAELEFVNTGPVIIDGWRFVTDNSIKGGLGMEFIFDDAASGPEINRRLRNMQVAIRENSGEFTHNQSCATHVHLDMTDFPVERVPQLMEAVLMTEPYLFWYAGNERWDNIFCVPWVISMPPPNLLHLEERLQGDVTFWDDLRGRVSKYSAVNPLPLARFGTLEFRHWPGTNNMKLLRNWIGLCMHVKRLALGDKDLVEETNSDKPYVETLFGPLARLFKDAPPNLYTKSLYSVLALRALRPE